MGVAGFLGAGLAGENSGQGRLALGQAIERGDYVVERFEVVHAVGAAAKFSGSLRATEEEHADDGDFAAVEIESFLQAVFEFSDAAVGTAGRASEAFFLQRGEGVANRGFVQRHHWVAIVFLVAGVDQGVEGERVIVGRGDVFFDQGAEDASFDFGEEHWDVRVVILIHWTVWQRLTERSSPQRTLRGTEEAKSEPLPSGLE